MSEAQSGCVASSGTIYGDPDLNERAKCVLPTLANDGLYAVGMREDSVLIAKVALTGEIVWARTFDIVPGEIDFVTTAILDAAGMIVVVGVAGDYFNGGTVFAFRYNPLSDQVLWAKEYVNSTGRNYGFAVVEKPNGNYFLASNAHPPLPATSNDDELFEISQATGAILPTSIKVFQLGGSDATGELIVHQGFIYGTGRYTDGLPNTKMRNTLLKFDLNTLTPVWVKMGHIPGSQTARLYGKDLVIESDQIYSIYSGDPAGTSLSNTKFYIQKTDLDGNLIWLKQYELPGNNDVAHQLISSAGGFVVLAGKNAAPSDIILFKVDTNGGMLWAKQFQFSPPIISSIQMDRGNSQIQEIGGSLYVTATGVNTDGSTDILIVKTDLDGETNIPCVNSVNVSIPVQTISNPAFYPVSPDLLTDTYQTNDESPGSVQTILLPRAACTILDTLNELVNATICPGESYEGYTMTGTYKDYFISSEGCDSLRTLELDVYSPPTTIEQAEICLGETYNGYTNTGSYPDTFPNYLGCDSIHILILNVVPLETNISIQICEGQNYEGYTQAGFYIDTLKGQVNACDTIRHLNLIVNPPLLTGINASICAGQSFLGYTVSGTYRDTFQTDAGCDSVRILHLIVSDEIFHAEAVQICVGDIYQGYSDPGMYIDTFLSAFGCDSIRQLELTLTMTLLDLNASICEGSNYLGHTQSGIYLDTLPGTMGECDTVRTITLFVSPILERTLDIMICEGQTFEGYGLSGTYVDTFQTPNGCDSIRELHLEVVDAVTHTIRASLCDPNTPYTLPAGEYIDTLISVRGCDSIRTLILERASIFIPNVFSPNQDGINDVFMFTAYPAIEPDLEYFAIFDRFGDMVYQTRDWPVMWKGDDPNGALFQPGVFAYILTYQCGQQKNSLFGNITLIK